MRHPIYTLRVRRTHKGIDLADLSSALLLTGGVFLLMKSFLDGFPLLILLAVFYLVALRLPALWRKLAPPHALEHFLVWVFTPERLEVGADRRPLPLAVEPLRRPRQRRSPGPARPGAQAGPAPSPERSR